MRLNIKNSIEIGVSPDNLSKCKVLSFESMEGISALY